MAGLPDFRVGEVDEPQRHKDNINGPRKCREQPPLIDNSLTIQGSNSPKCQVIVKSEGSNSPKCQGIVKSTGIEWTFERGRSNVRESMGVAASRWWGVHKPHSTGIFEADYGVFRVQ